MAHEEEDSWVPPADDGDRPFEAFDTASEQFLIGFCLREGGALELASAIIGPNDFYHPLHQRIFERMLAKQAAVRPITPGTVSASMKNDPEFQQVGGIDYLNDWYLGAPSVRGEALHRQTVDIAKTLKELRLRRDAIAATYDAWLDLQSPKEIEEALAPLLEINDAKIAQADIEGGSVQVKDAAYQLFKELEAPDDPATRALIAPTGIGPLDVIIGGIAPANLLIAGGRPGMGKSVLGTTMAMAAAGLRREYERCWWDAEAAHFVDYFSLEMTARELTARMLCDIDFDIALRDGRQPTEYSMVNLRRVSADQIGHLVEANLILADLPLEIHDRDRMTIEDITAVVRAKQAAHPGPRTVIIDHMHLIEPSDRYRGRKVDEISEITRGAKRLAKRLGVGVVLLAQLNREIEKREDKAPTMADFRDAGSIEQDADAMIGLNRPAYWLARPKSGETEVESGQREAARQAKANVLEVGVLKNRHGKTAEIACFVSVQCSAIRDEQPVYNAGAGVAQGRLEF